MSFTPDMNRLSLDQAPPLAIPASFFATAPLAIIAAGTLLTWTGAAAFQSNWLPLTLGLTHLGTLGFLTMVMMGALYQMTPVVAGASVPAIRLAHLVHALLAIGVVCLTLHLTGIWPGSPFIPFSVITLAVVIFLATVGWALATTSTKGETVAGMRFALLCLLFLATLGILMARGFYDGTFPGPRPLWIQVHLGIALLGWVGGLISAVSWQVVPMFYLTTPTPRLQKQIVFGLVILGIILPLGVLLLDYTGATGVAGILNTVWQPKTLAAFGALPAAFSVWFLHPHITFHNLRKRRRKRLDTSLLFWQSGLVMAPFTAIAAAAALLWPVPRGEILFGWLAIWGWAGLIMHGMLSRILPFLVWFHRFSHYVGKIPVPAMRTMLPDRWTRLGLIFHLASLICGAAAILTINPWIARLAGLLLIATGANLLAWIIHLLRQFPDTRALQEKNV